MGGVDGDFGVGTMTRVLGSVEDSIGNEELTGGSAWTRRMAMREPMLCLSMSGDGGDGARVTSKC